MEDISSRESRMQASMQIIVTNCCPEEPHRLQSMCQVVLDKTVFVFVICVNRLLVLLASTTT